ncbi:MAG: hypothetical protein HYV26_04850 [Candidatus Hydrogenedentes bacterium]|nr:hypothetical protein [Candidatus Hydrogenedentota bacterium]
MKKAEKDELRREYRREDLGKGIRGRFLKEYEAGTNFVLLDPDVAAAFPTEEAVNSTLRALLELANRAAVKSPARPRSQLQP